MSGFINIMVVVGIFIALTKYIPINLLLSAKSAGVNVTLTEILNMTRSKTPPEKILKPAIKAKNAGIKISITQLQAHYAAGGNVDKVVNALIAAKRKNATLTFENACMLDLEGKATYKVSKPKIMTKTLETPLISAAAKDRGEVKIKAVFKVTIDAKQANTHINEEAIIEKVEEGILDIISRVNSREKVVDNLEFVTNIIMKKKVDEGTGCNIERIKLIVV